MYFLVIFNRSAGKILTQVAFDNAEEALEARFKAERRYRDDPAIEIVVLGADSVEALRRTHGRYFRTFDDLAAALP